MLMCREESSHSLAHSVSYGTLCTGKDIFALQVLYCAVVSRNVICIALAKRGAGLASTYLPTLKIRVS